MRIPLSGQRRSLALVRLGLVGRARQGRDRNEHPLDELHMQAIGKGQAIAEPALAGVDLETTGVAQLCWLCWS